ACKGEGQGGSCRSKGEERARGEGEARTREGQERRAGTRPEAGPVQEVERRPSKDARRRRSRSSLGQAQALPGTVNAQAFHHRLQVRDASTGATKKPHRARNVAICQFSWGSTRASASLTPPASSRNTRLCAVNTATRYEYGLPFWSCPNKSS